jgi:hypothetical protein
METEGYRIDRLERVMNVLDIYDEKMGFGHVTALHDRKGELTVFFVNALAAEQMEFITSIWREFENEYEVCFMADLQWAEATGNLPLPKETHSAPKGVS